MSGFLIVKNKANGVESKYTKEQWDKLTPKQKKIFNVKSIPTPKEVLDLEAEQKAAQDQAKTETGQKSTQVEKAPENTTKKKRTVKTKENNTGNQK